MKLGDIVRRWGTRFKRDDRMSPSIGPRMVVCELIDDNTVYAVPSDKFELTQAWRIVKSNEEDKRVIGTYLGKAVNSKGELVII